MKVRYCISDGYVNMKSDFVQSGIDLLELLASDISTEYQILEFYKKIFVDSDYWWSNLTKVEVEGSCAILSAAFALDSGAIPSKKIDINTLKQIVLDFREFVKNKVEFTKEY